MHKTLFLFLPTVCGAQYAARYRTSPDGIHNWTMNELAFNSSAVQNGYVFLHIAVSSFYKNIPLVLPLLSPRVCIYGSMHANSHFRVVFCPVPTTNTFCLIDPRSLSLMPSPYACICNSIHKHLDV